VDRLLDDLCVRLGYCLAPETQQRILADPPRTVDAFMDAVIEAEASIRSSWAKGIAWRFGGSLLLPLPSRYRPERCRDDRHGPPRAPRLISARSDGRVSLSAECADDWYARPSRLG
jgi:hypothetical protein